MAIIAGDYDFTVQRRSDHTESIRITDSNDAAIDLSSFTIAAQVWDKDRTGKYADFTIVKTNASNGEFTMSLTHVQTLQFTPNELAYDVLLLNSNNEREYYIQGTIFVSEGYTTIE
tara:strand:+ start:7981 stop:8328 length:348 start_codon:yes stop_codon:yes gene_type:complete